VNPRLAALGGIVFLVLSFATFGMAPAPPAFDAPPADIVAWYADDGDGIRAIAVTFAFAVMGLVVWVAGLRDLIWADGRRTGLAGATTTGVGLVAVCWLATAGISSAVAMRIEELGDDVVVFAATIANVLSAAGQMGLVLAIGGLTLAGSACGVLPRWATVIGWIAAAAALVATGGMAIDAEAFSAVVALAWLATTVWVVALTVVLLRCGPGRVEPGAGEREAAAAG